jgi:hypothetical protein
MKRFIGLLYFELLLCWMPALATTIVVRPDSSGDYPTIQAAITAAADGDTVELSTGVFAGDGNRNIDFLGKAITVRSRSGDPNSCIIDCQNQGRGFVFTTGEDTTSVLEGVTVTNGRNTESWESKGGGIFCLSEPQLKDCIICNCATTDGPYAPEGQGGGLYCADGSPLFVHCSFTNNRVWHEFHNSRGGGVYSEGAPRFIYCEFSQNSAESFDNPAYGGGVSGTGTFINCMFQGNLASSGGGAFGNGVFTNCIFYGNSAYSSMYVNGYGGGASGDGRFISCIFTANNSESGGGVYFANGGPQLQFCDIFGNLSNDLGGEIPAGLGPIVRVNFNGDSCDAYLNIFRQPNFRNAVNGDFHLMSTACGDPYDSPCIDAGDSTKQDDSLHCDYGLGTILCDIGLYGGHGKPIGLSAHDHPGLPGGYALHQNYPNPFNTITTITYDLSKAGNASLRVSDILGREVAVLKDGFVEAGTHRVTFDGSKLASGIYFVRLDAAPFSQTKKLMLLK